MILQDRDLVIFNEIHRHRFLLSRHVKLLCDFPSQRACDQRLKKLIDSKYIERKYILYGIPSLLFLTDKTKRLLNLKYVTKDIRVDKILHDINVIETYIYLIYCYKLDKKVLQTEREIKQEKLLHTPDIIFIFDNSQYAIEVEMSEKSFDKLEKIIKGNYLKYEKQIYIISENQTKIIDNVNKLKSKYDNINILALEKMKEYVKSL